jgi:hypothetical protein
MRWRVTLAAGSLAASLGAIGHAQRGEYGRSATGSDSLFSPTSFAVELRLGQYPPAIDDEFSGATPYADIFGHQKRFLVGVEVDWQALKQKRLFSVGPGLGWGMTKMTAGALLSGGGRAAQQTSLTIMPVYLVVVGRVDALSQVHVPVQPYVKAGLGYGLWWVGDGQRTASSSGVVGRGSSFGYQFALGAALNLTALDPDSAKEMDKTSGISTAGLFVEWYFSRLGSGSQMHIGTSTWMAGVLVEM